jgi:predicted transcriptional regulator
MYSIAYEWNMHKMASKKFVSNFAWKGLQEKTKSDEGKERKGGGLYYYY